MTRWLRRLPLGARIAALTSGTLVALLVIVGVFVHRQFREALRDEADRELVDRARIAARSLQDAPGAEFPTISWTYSTKLARRPGRGSKCS